MAENLGGYGPAEHAQHAGGDGATPGHRRAYVGTPQEARGAEAKVGDLTMANKLLEPRSSGWKPPAL
jgi:hypothetical protein